MIRPGDADGSPLVGRLRGAIEPRMPLDGPPFLDDDQIAAIVRWIDAGAPMDGDVPTAHEPAAAPPRDGPPTFADVAPILKRHCIVCHSDNGRLDAPPEGLRLIDHASVTAGGDRVVVIPGNVAASELWRRITGRATPRMPFDGPPWLTDDEVGLLAAWIEAGAMDAAGRPAPVPVGQRIRIRGPMTGPAEIDGVPFATGPDTRFDDPPAPGTPAELRATVAPDGSLTADRLRSR